MTIQKLHLISSNSLREPGACQFMWLETNAECFSDSAKMHAFVPIDISCNHAQRTPRHADYDFVRLPYRQQAIAGFRSFGLPHDCAKLVHKLRDFVPVDRRLPNQLVGLAQQLFDFFARRFGTHSLTPYWGLSISAASAVPCLCSIFAQSQERKLKLIGNDDSNPLAYVISHNLHRRHLDASQRSMVAARIKPMFEAQAEGRMSAGGKAARRGESNAVEKLPPHVARLTTDAEIHGEGKQYTTADVLEGLKARDAAGASVNVSLLSRQG